MYRFIRALVRLPFITVSFLLLMVVLMIVIPISVLCIICKAKDVDEFRRLWYIDWDAYKSVIYDMWRQGA